HHFKAIEVTDFSAETHTFRCRGSDGVEIALEEPVDGSSLEYRDRRGDVSSTRCDDPRLIEQAPGGCAITRHGFGDRRHAQRVRQQTGIVRLSSSGYYPFKRRSGRGRIG